MDWNSDGDIDWVVVSQANYYKVESVNSKRLTVSTMSAKNSDKKSEETSTDEVTATWKLDDLNDKSDYKVKYEAPEDLKEGDVIEVTYKTSYVKSEKCEVVTATIKKVEANSHELDKVSTKDTLQLTFDGDVMKIAQNKNEGDVIVPANPTTYGDFDDEELGTEFNLWTDRNGFIVYADYAKESSNYMMILDTKDGSDKTGDRSLAVADILLADNSVKKDVKFASDLKIDGENGGNTGYNKEGRAWVEKLVVGNVYKYWTDGDGVVTKMESQITVKDAKKDKDYSYNKSSDRLKKSDGGFVASLDGAKVIFAVTQDYISGTGDLKVNSGNVMAVKKSDVPDINNGNNTTGTAYLVKSTSDNWLKDVKGTNDTDGARFIANVDKNGEASAAILGVENFNKFNDASTKVGLVTSVSYDKNKVVSIDVAYNGKVDTLSSAEKKDFDDIVEAYNQKSKEDKSVSSPTSTVNNALFDGAKLSDYLKKNGAYAEITTDGDGKLTAVTFMDKDGSNKVVGHYYEVSRRIITGVKNNNVVFGNQDAYFYNSKSLYSVGRLDVDDADVAKDVQYYSISGRPTTHDDKYDNVMLSVVNGFDGTPSIKAQSDSILIKSYINDKFDDADTYQVADLARKIGGDIVAAFAFDGTLGETDKAGGAVVSVDDKADVRNNGAEVDIADVQKVANGGNVTGSVTVYNEDGKTVATGVTARLDGKDLKVKAETTATAGKYVAKFTVDNKEYEVKFAVKAADVVVPTSDAKVEKAGIAKVDEKDAVTKITFKGTSGSAATKFAVELNGEKITVEMQANQNGPRYAATALANAIADNLIKGITATASEESVTVTGKGTDVAVDFIPGNSKLTADIDTEQKYVAPVAAQKGKATLTITSGVDVETKLALAVDGDEFTAVTIPAKASADDIAKALAEAASSSDRFDVTYKDNVITVEQKAGFNFTKDSKMDLTIVNKN